MIGIKLTDMRGLFVNVIHSNHLVRNGTHGVPLFTFHNIESM